MIYYRFYLFLMSIFFLSACSQPEIARPPTLDPQTDAGRGEMLFRANCATCHTVIGDTVVVGPSLAGVATRAAERVADLSAEDYLSNSILYPNDFIVPGYENSAMQQNFATMLTSEDVDYLIAYLLTLK